MRQILLEAFHAAVRAAQPEDAVRRALPDLSARGDAIGRVKVVAVGKAAPAMVAALAGWSEFTGVGVTKYGQAPTSATPRMRWLEASHPLPDAGSVAAGAAIQAFVTGLRPDDLLLCLISGGASALVSAPDGVTLQHKTALSVELLGCGADIGEINTVRKHLSKLKGGRLAALAHPASVLSLIVSDVVGDDIATIASGLTAPDGTSFQAALKVLNRYEIPAPEVRARLTAGARGEIPETPKPHDPIFQRVTNQVIVSNLVALEAARNSLESCGFVVTLVDDAVQGETRAAALDHARLARGLTVGQMVLTGGETTARVTATNPGRGGRNLEYALQLAIEDVGVWALAADSDGIDGSSFAAGALVTPDTLTRAAKLGLNPLEAQARNDAHSFFEALGDLIVTGETGTNVNDLRFVTKGLSG